MVRRTRWAKERAAEAMRISNALDADSDDEATDEARINRFIDLVDHSKLADGYVLDVFRDLQDYGDFKACSMKTLVSLCELLMRRGIYVADYGEVKDSLARSMPNLAYSGVFDWPEEGFTFFSRSNLLQSYNRELQENVDPSFIDPKFILSTEDSSALSASNLSYSSSSSVASSDYAADSSDGQNSMTGKERPLLPKFQLSYQEPARLDKDMFSAMRQIRNNFPKEMKYTGFSDEMGIVYRTKQFLEFCSDNGLAESWLIATLPAMMDYGLVLDYCNKVRHTVTDWRLVIQRMAERFEDDCVVRERENKWYNASLAEITRAKPEMLLSEALQKLYEYLATLQLSLPESLSSEEELFERLMTVFEKDVRTSKHAAVASQSTSDPTRLYWSMKLLVMGDERRAELSEGQSAGRVRK
ncbi:hypothetical protein SEPCBS119000_002137 [Sporothrix epigloea]|uniref:Uncharacterized protein n=1 Tax=Sporothrix epigloea TaxID=1892477 RepID=A0ABP0DEI6_9PEZI